MHEDEWAGHSNPSTMLAFLDGKASDRSFRLFACACCRRIWEVLPDAPNKRAVEVAEMWLCGLTAESERQAAAIEAEATSTKLFNDVGASPLVKHAAHAAFFTLSLDVSGFSAARQLQLAALVIASHFADDSDDQDDDSACLAIGSEEVNQCRLIREIFPNPFRSIALDPKWRTGNVSSVARRIYAQRSFEDMPILADALEDAGCTDSSMLQHCREPTRHVRGCWVLDLLL